VVYCDQTFDQKGLIRLRPTSAFYSPADGWVGDVIPYAHAGRVWLFYLHEYRENPKPGTPWDVISTTDFIDFTEHGTAIESGGPKAYDFNAYTGSVVKHEGRHYLYYTGHNPDILGDNGLPLQVVMVATSDDDMATWDKRPELTFGAPENYETSDWRDPFVFRVNDTEPWRMLITARWDHGPDRRRGVIAQLKSDDLINWQIAEPFYAPGRYVAHECPDVFKWGDWWYLVYSEFTDAFVTRYRMARSPEGPWFAPKHDTVDGRAFYASKSVSHEGRRFFIGWIATKEQQRDDGPYQWAGTLSTLEATQKSDGTLAFSSPQELRDIYSRELEIDFGVENLSSSISVPAEGMYAAQISKNIAPEAFRFQCRIEIGPDMEACGLLLRASEDGNENYAIRLEPRRGRLVFDRWPRKSIGDMQWQISGDVPHAIELERSCELEPGMHTLDVIVDNSTFVATLDEETTLSARMYDRSDGHIGLFAAEGTAVFSDLRLSGK